MSIIKLIVGLSNPGAEYAATRHNAGAWYTSLLAGKNHQILKNEPRFYGYTARINLHGQDVRLLIPSTFMNLSGKSVNSLANFYQIKPEEILVAHDELDLMPGYAKLKFGGSHGGHNGLKDVINKLNNNVNFYRLRIGIGHPVDKHKVTGYVLGKPTRNEQQRIDAAIDKAIDCTAILVEKDMQAATNQLHAFKFE